MTGGTGSVGHAWPAKVLAGDPVACRVLALARALPDADLDALARHAEQMAAGTLTADVTARQEVGQTSG